MTTRDATRRSASDRRTHYVTTTDGVTIGAAVHGQGPPLVLLQGLIGDGDLDWHPLVGRLAHRFTCHLPSLRGRGLSEDHADLSPGRHVEDVLAYVDSLRAPTAIAGWSYGAGLALAVAAQSDAVDAVAAFEPGIGSVMDEHERAAFGAAIARAADLAAGGSLAAAARTFGTTVFDDEEIAVAEEAGYFEAAGRHVPNLLGVLRQLLASEDHIGDPVLGAITAPVAVLHGTTTKRFFTAGARHVTEHVPHARTHELRGAGHAAPLTHPEALADAVTASLSPAGQPA